MADAQTQEQQQEQQGQQEAKFTQADIDKIVQTRLSEQKANLKAWIQISLIIVLPMMLFITFLFLNVNVIQAIKEPKLLFKPVCVSMAITALMTSKKFILKMVVIWKWIIAMGMV